ncbi:hypothetical protein ACP4OV_023746 [Aristida adscensionis]
MTWFPDDAHYDRFWYPMDQAMYQAISPQKVILLATGLTIQPDPNFQEPPSVLQTAIAATANTTMLTAYTWKEQRAALSFMMFLHFADFRNTQLRQFDIYFNNNQLGTSHSPSSLAAKCVYSSTPYRSSDGTYNISLIATTKSVLPPMINALEVYFPIAHQSPTTFSKDIDAIMAIKIEYGVKKNWTGDPCFPKYAWAGVKCSNTSDNTTRIISLDLSNSSLHGVISTSFTLLAALENLVLYDMDKNMCNETRSRSKKTFIVLIASVVGSVLVMAEIFLACFIWRKKTKPNVSIDDHATNLQLNNVTRSRSSQGDLLQLQDTENRRFEYKELEKFTDNFKWFIGQGGFGLVYYGRLEDGTDVAVKMCSESSSHGLDEFLAEVQSLTKVHHRNLVSLVGYCWERDHLALVYEYMSQGNLYQHLKTGSPINNSNSYWVKNAVSETLNWGTRVRVVLEAAQGLDYLHKGCSLPIIHRDVKTSNILLGQNLQAKIADLGLSKTYLSDAQTHVSATVAGTAGYMDPEYYLTGRLTESSDVYSFEVVLLEIATGEPPLVPGHGHIVQRVKQRIATGDVGSVADPRLGGAYDVSSMWKVVDTAMLCTADAAAGRPTMAAVVAQLKDSLALEEARGNECSDPVSLASDSTALMSEFGPTAR